MGCVAIPTTPIQIHLMFLFNNDYVFPYEGSANSNTSHVLI